MRLTIFACGLAFLGASLPSPAARPAALSDDQKAMHVLNRLGFGARPGDVARVKAMGVRAYISQQLAWENIDDTDVRRKAAALETLHFGPERLARIFRDGQGNAPGVAEVKKRREARALATRVVAELQAEKILYAVESKRQLYEVMVDFWSNHFNIDVRKQQARTLKAADERDVIRKHAMGKFRDLLGASAHSPAMLIYLDNVRSTAPMRGRGGLNENYARELMELHTLGVDGGYSQDDVREVARCLTGWSLDPLTGKFRFLRARHDNGEKKVLGQTIPAGGGAADGEKVLDILARHPSTARFIARKLCIRFIGDHPPKTVIERAAAMFVKSEGDIRETVRTIVNSGEFFSPDAYRARVKSPFEFAVSAVRAVGATVETGVPTRGDRGLAGHIARMGQPLFQCQAPTGYPETSNNWLGAGGLVARFNFALALARGEIPDVTLPAEPVVGAAGFLGASVSGETRDALVKHGSDPTLLLALTLGSPEFQRR